MQMRTNEFIFGAAALPQHFVYRVVDEQDALSCIDERLITTN